MKNLYNRIIWIISCLKIISITNDFLNDSINSLKFPNSVVSIVCCSGRTTNDAYVTLNITTNCRGMPIFRTKYCVNSLLLKSLIYCLPLPYHYMIFLNTCPICQRKKYFSFSSIQDWIISVIRIKIRNLMSFSLTISALQKR
jgi:hypothetical protein